MSLFESDSAAERRDDAWLTARTQTLRIVHFSDVPQGYPISVRFGIRARNRFGSIAARSGKTIILINALFSDPYVPTYVVDGTLAHELAHYAHGYGSGLPVLYPDPHRGGVVDRELEHRSLGEVNRRAEAWRKAHWAAFYNSRCTDIQCRREARLAEAETVWLDWFETPGHRTLVDLLRHATRLAERFGLDCVPFDLEWLHATVRQEAPSYWFAKSGIVRVHGLLADPRVPQCSLDAELAYWIARRCAGSSPPRIQAALRLAGLAKTMDDALRWRRAAWTRFRGANHPLLDRTGC